MRNAARWVLLIACLSACSKAPGPETPAPAATLADRMEKLSPRQQLQALAADSSAEASFFRGNAYFSLGVELPESEHPRAVTLYDSALVAYQHAVETDTTMSKAWVNMGLTYDALAKRPEARRAFETAIATNPEDVLALCHLGFSQTLIGDLDAAMKLYKRALAIDPNSSQAHYNLGLAFAEAKLFKEALVEWETVVRLEPDGDLGRAAADNVRIIRQYIADGK